MKGLLQSVVSTPSSCHVIIGLGPNLQCLPLESMQVLRDQPVSRISSATFLSALLSLQSSCSPLQSSVVVDPRHTFYVLDPQGDLSHTAKKFKKWFSSEKGWRGVVSRTPTTEELSSALENCHMYM